VWRDNTYPGAACDIPSPFYSYSYDPNPNWPRRFSQQPAILDYIHDVVDKFDLRRHMRFDSEVTAAAWDDASGRWHIETTSGPVEADVLVPAVGQLSRPVLPKIAGLGTFAGAAFHSAQWDHTVDLKGKRIAVIGTGASAIQLIPEIQPDAAKLLVFQRTAPYLLPRLDTQYTELHKKVFSKLPVTLKAERIGWFGVSESLATAQLYAKPLAKAVERISRSHLNRQVKDPVLRAKLWPDYAIGCKRILFSSNYFPALAQPNVDVVTDGIAEITEKGVRTKDGVLHEVDVIIYGTGFAATDFLGPMHVTGAGGRELKDEWSSGAHAYLGITVPDFPNLFMVYGPNTNTGSASIIAFEESQAGYIRQAVEHISATRGPIAVRRDVEHAFDESLQKRLATSVWSVCSNWYRDANGRISTNWPGLLTEYQRRTAHFKTADYEAVATTAATTTTTAARAKTAAARGKQ
jgi:cation diffusion facilitator CzcD-associated flavoprotein CzcO